MQAYYESDGYIVTFSAVLGLQEGFLENNNHYLLMVKIVHAVGELLCLVENGWSKVFFTNFEAKSTAMTFYFNYLFLKTQVGIT